MVDGINNISPRLPATGEIKKTETKGDASVNAPQSQPAKEPQQIRGEENNSVSSAILKSADKRIESLISGNVADFIQEAEKFIDASLPSQPPGTKLRIALDDGSGRFIYQGVDINTGDVVSQFPSEEILKFIAFNRERDGVEGIVVDEEV